MLRSFDDDDIDNVDNDDDDDWHEDAVDNHIDDMGMMVTKLMTCIMWFAMMIMIDADFDKCNFYVELVQEAAQQITGHTPRSHINFTFHDCMHALFQYVGLNVIPNVVFNTGHTISRTPTSIFSLGNNLGRNVRNRKI